MADPLPTFNIPLPPRTPTPPPEQPGPSVEEPILSYNPNNLSPYRPEDEMETPQTSYFTPATPEKKNDATPFNFQPAAMAKSPVVKSVRISALTMNTANRLRTLANGEDTSTNTAVCHIRSFSNLLLEHLLRCPTPYLFQHSQNAGRA